jgi:aspartate kinase
VSPPLIVKFGGDALATPERIALAAARVASRRLTRPVVAVASARRGVTDHLLALVDQVRDATRRERQSSPAGRAAADRAVASGELVAASLLAVALEELGIPSAVLDAREAGLRSDGHAGGATLTDVRPTRIERLLGRGVVPVVTGFQGWHRGRLTTLGRGGSDITAVALAGELAAEACELVKDPGALHTADPRLVAEARPLRRVGHRFVTELALSGARVIHHVAASRAEHDGIPLRFTSLRADDNPATEVSLAWSLEPVESVVLAAGHRGMAAADDGDDVATVTVVSGDAASGRHHAAAGVVAAAGHRVLRMAHRPHAVSFLVRAADGDELLRTLHATIGASPDTGDAGWRMYVGHR